MDRIVVYVDGFNLYYGIRKLGCKWLDLSALSRRVLPHDDVVAIRYFTARVKPTVRDPDVDRRQQMYLGALATLADVTVHYGQFLVTNPRMPVFQPPPNTIQVIKTEEKGSDVNLATNMVVDGFQGLFDTAVLVSNDSDFVPTILAVRETLGLKVGVFFQPTDTPSQALRRAATFAKELRPGQLRASQFPDTLTDPVGAFSKPGTW